MLDRAASELSIVGRSGKDFVWSTVVDLDQLETHVDDETVELAAGEMRLSSFEAQNFKSLESSQFVQCSGRSHTDQPDVHEVAVSEPGGSNVLVHNYSNSSIDQELPLRNLPLLRAFGGTTLLRLDARKLVEPSASMHEQPTVRSDGMGLPSVLADLAATDTERLDRVF